MCMTTKLFYGLGHTHELTLNASMANLAEIYIVDGLRWSF